MPQDRDVLLTLLAVREGQVSLSSSYEEHMHGSAGILLFTEFQVPFYCVFRSLSLNWRVSDIYATSPPPRYCLHPAKHAEEFLCPNTVNGAAILRLYVPSSPGRRAVRGQKEQ